MSEQLCSFLVVGDSFSPLPFTHHCVWHDHGWKMQRATWLLVSPTEKQASVMPPAPSSASFFVLFVKTHGKNEQEGKKM